MGKLIRNDIAKRLHKKIADDIRYKNESISLDSSLDSVDQEFIENSSTMLNALSEQDINTLIKLCTQVMSDALIAGNSIELRDFGVFELRVRKAKKKARNPKTGEGVTVPEHTVVAFRSGKRLKNAVWTLDDV